MATIKLRNGIELSDFGKPYFVAELNTSHFGDLETARQMIVRAREVGCDCVKFQSWSTQSLYSKSFYDANPVARRMVGKFALAEDSLRDLALVQRYGLFRRWRPGSIAGTTAQSSTTKSSTRTLAHSSG